VPAELIAAPTGICRQASSEEAAALFSASEAGMSKADVRRSFTDDVYTVVAEPR
jgi:hypothetical protein